MLCPGGHEIIATAKTQGYLPFHTKHTCYLCGTGIGGGERYHGCSSHCTYTCGICYESAKSSYRYDRYKRACKEPFPAGLGPFDMAQTSLEQGDLKVGDRPNGRCSDCKKGGPAMLGASFFSHSEGLMQLWQALISHGAVALPAAGISRRDASAAYLAVHLSPLWPMSLSPHERRTLDLNEGAKAFFAWLYPPVLDWPSLLHNLNDLELKDSDESLLTLGGFVYFRAPSGVANATDLRVISAQSLLFRPQGNLTFSEPQVWQSCWTPSFSRSGRFQTVCAHKWHKAGAQKMCWIGFGESLQSLKGDRCVGHRGGFVILFGGSEANGSFYEVISNPTSTILNIPIPRQLGRKLGRQMSLRRSISGGLPFSIERPNPDNVSRLRSRLFALAQKGHWGLVAHLLTEYPVLAGLKDEETGESVLHKCALAKCNDHFLLGRLYRFGVQEDLKDNRGRTACDLGDRLFCTLVHQIWGLVPDLFKCPEAWFEHWDLDKNGVLEPAELSEALAAAYDVGDLGRKWIQTYVNTYYDELARGGSITKAAFVDDGGLLDMLQSSDDFVHLRAKDRPQMPALFHNRKRQPSQGDAAALFIIESNLDEMRREAGWFVEPGRSAPDPKLVKEISLPPPFSAGDADPIARLAAAREMLAWTFAKTSLLTGEDWKRGFRVSFRGEDGIDDFGLTKAWIQELAFALWGDDLLFEEKSSGFLFKPDTVTHVQLHCFNIKTSELYYWCGCFLAYAIYSRCVVDCRLCPWVLRWLQRIQDPDYVRFCETRSIDGDWCRARDGECVAEIENSVLRSYDSDSCVHEMPLQIDGDSLEFEIDGSSFSGLIDNGRILWDDGDVWEKCMDDSPPSRARPCWPASQSGEEQMLEDVACLDPDLANSYWRMLHELSDDDWKSWVLCVDDEDVDLNSEMKLQHVQERCLENLWSQTRVGLSMFLDGFMEVIPPGFTASCPDDTFLWLLGGGDITVDQISALERLVLKSGLVPRALAEHQLVQQSARWAFAIAKEGDGKFRNRFLEFWMGISRMPMTGPSNIKPEPKLQVMVQRDYKEKIKPISSWPSTRLPEGHTCGNELWIPLCKTKEELSRNLKMAVGNFEAGFAIS